MRKSEDQNKIIGLVNTEKGQIVEHLGKDRQGKVDMEMSMSTEDHQGSQHQEGKAHMDEAVEVNTETIEAINEVDTRIQEGEMATAMADKKEMIVASEEEEEAKELQGEMMGKEITTMRIRREQIQDIKVPQSKRRTMKTTTKMSIGLLKKRKELHSQTRKDNRSQTQATTTDNENMTVKETR